MDVIKHIDELCRKKGYSYYMLAKKSNLAYSSISNMFHKGTTPNVYTLEKICTGLDITLSQFFCRDNRLCDLTEREENLIAIFSELPENKKDLLLAYAQGLSHE